MHFQLILTLSAVSPLFINLRKPTGLQPIAVATSFMHVTDQVADSPFYWGMKADWCGVVWCGVDNTKSVNYMCQRKSRKWVYLYSNNTNMTKL